jgi:hypothetical protein
MAEPTTPNPDVESTETAFHGEKELESMRRWSDHEPGFPAGTGPLGKPEEWEPKHEPHDRQVTPPSDEGGETAEKGPEELESMRRWGDHEPGFPAGTGPLGKPEEWEQKHEPGDRPPA